MDVWIVLAHFLYLSKRESKAIKKSSAKSGAMKAIIVQKRTLIFISLTHTERGVVPRQPKRSLKLLLSHIHKHMII